MLTDGIREDIKRLSSLAGPAIAAQLGAMMLWVVDIAMLGRFGVEALDGVALGRTWISGTMVLGVGLILGLDPIATQAFGRQDKKRLDAVFADTFAIAMGMSVVLAVAWALTEPMLLLFEQDPELAAIGGVWAQAQIPSIPFLMTFFVLKHLLLAQGRVRMPMVVVIGANLVNALANWLLIFGPGPFPELGALGAGMSTSITQAAMTIVLLWWMHRVGDSMPWQVWKLRTMAGIGAVVGFGWPVAIQVGLEMWTFQISTLLAGRLGHISLAAHTIALTLDAVIYMIPLGISFAVATRVGNQIGAGKPHEAQRAAWVAMAMTTAIMAMIGVGFWFGRAFLPRLITNENEVVAVAALLMPIAAAFKLFDGIQVVAAGALRGQGLTKAPAVINLIGFYVIALPLGIWLAFSRGMDVVGIWWGFLAGLFVTAGTLTFWLWRFGPSRIRSTDT
ncbi:MAG: MATE family efflux transporter [Acidobacteriota bacterium]